MGRIKPRPGHTLFEVDLIKGQIRKAKFDTVDFTGKKKKIVVKNGCIYVPALNIKNVKKKLKRKGYIE